MNHRNVEASSPLASVRIETKQVAVEIKCQGF